VADSTWGWLALAAVGVWALLQRARGQGQASAMPDRVSRYNVVGESFYADALARLFPRPRGRDDDEHDVSVELRPESGNPHDDQAVAVYIGSAKVGHLSRADARAYRKVHGRRPLRCGAVVYAPAAEDEYYSVQLVD
jgi:hypothetical protein